MVRATPPSDFLVHETSRRERSSIKTATVIGSGPNGLAAGVRLAQAGVRVSVLEAEDTPGGGTRTQELTLPGFNHDVCSAVHPMAASSPFFSSLPLESHGLRWIHPEIALAHPFDDGSALTIERSLNATADKLGQDGEPYRRLFEPFVTHWDELAPAILGPLLRVPAHPLLLAQFGLRAIQGATGLARRTFSDTKTRALFAGVAAHSNTRIDTPLSSGIALALIASGHVGGWPLAGGGSASIAQALVTELRSLGGSIETSRKVESIREFDASDAILFDLSPRQVSRIAKDQLDETFRRRLARFRFGAGVFKVDFALDAPIPWTAADCRRAGTVHIGGTMDEIESAELSVARGVTPERPFVILAQPSLFDPSRAPEGKHTCWAYCHVPNSSTVDMVDRLEAQIERFAPGFRDLVLARHTMGPGDLEQYNANYIGGDIAAGAAGGLQLVFRPTRRLSPYTTTSSRIFICSSSTPPGPGVHGMCGYYAAQAALKKLAR